MDEETYDKIKCFCIKILMNCHHNRHLDDITQFVAMKHFETQGKKSWKFSAIDYMRENGLTKIKSKLGAKAIENSSLGLEDNEFLLNHKTTEDIKTITKAEILERFLKPLNLSEGVLEWVVKLYKVRTL